MYQGCWSASNPLPILHLDVSRFVHVDFMQFLLTMSFRRAQSPNQALENPAITGKPVRILSKLLQSRGDFMTRGRKFTHMTYISRLRLVLVSALALAGIGAQAQTITAIYNFGSATDDPLKPQNVGVIAQGEDGDMYSTTPAGGTNGLGAAFKLSPSGARTVLHNFSSSDGTPYSGLTLGTDGNFYGTTCNGGASREGTVFKMTRTGKLTVLYNFTGGNDGKCPLAPPIEGIDGNYYGTTSGGGLSAAGTVYKVTAAGSLTTIFQFDETNGYNPEGPLVQAADGNFYGTTNLGNENCGFDNICATVFKLTPSGDFTQLHSFPFNPFFNSIYATGLSIGNDGYLYGAVVQSGTGHGEVFKINTSGTTFKDLHDFTGETDGANPYAGLLLANNGNFYGVAAADGADGFGVVYETSSAGKFSAVAAFDGTDGAYPSTPLIQNTNGTIYGDANQGGEVTNTGTFFKITGISGLESFVSLLPASGKVGTKIGILGQGFQGTTKVSFNGVATTFKVVSENYLTATVPNRATSGTVTVTTPSGVLKSNKKFSVTKSADVSDAAGEGPGSDSKWRPPQIGTFNPASGVAGTVVQITGTDLTQTYWLKFNGVPSNGIKVYSNTLVTATVPAGATTGPISITWTSPGGYTASTSTSFTVTP
jgi:uncharacterized repeat protein (TIGR03803 family)